MSPDQHHKDLEALKAQIDTLSPVAARFVARLIGSLSSPPQATVNPQTTWITESDDWVEYFSHALSVHHGTTTEPLGLTGFEIVFCNACDAVGWEYEKPASVEARCLSQGDGGYSRCSARAASAAPMPISSPVPISASV